MPAPKFETPRVLIVGVFVPSPGGMFRPAVEYNPSPPISNIHPVKRGIDPLKFTAIILDGWLTRVCEFDKEPNKVIHQLLASLVLENKLWNSIRAPKPTGEMHTDVRVQDAVVVMG